MARSIAISREGFRCRGHHHTDSFHSKGFRCLKHFYAVCLQAPSPPVPKAVSYNGFVELQKSVLLSLTVFIKEVFWGLVPALHMLIQLR